MAWALMFLSGWAALTYEAVWLRMLARSFGVTVHAVAALVALYMAGLAIGAAVGARLRWRGDWLRLYALLEAGSGVAAALGTWWLLRLPGVVAAGSESGLSPLARLALAAPALLPPTILLGATLPVLTRRFSEAGRLYAANTLGATAGVAVTSGLVIGSCGETAAVGSAAALNLLCAALAWSASGARGKAAAPAASTRRPRPALVVGLFAVSGFCALGYEVIWTRQLVPLIGNSTYAFALLLVFYLAGIGLGSWAGARRRAAGESALAELALLLAALGCAAALSAAAYRAIGLSLDAQRYLYSPLKSFADFGLIAVVAAGLVVPVSLLLGALFPAAYRALTPEDDDGEAVGALYAWNTVGGILGSLWAGFWGIQHLGANAAFLLLAAVQTACGVAAVSAAPRAGAMRRNVAALAALALLAGVYARRDPALDILLKRLGRQKFEVMFHDHSAAATITGVAFERGRNLYINGIETSGDGLAGIIMAIVPTMLLERADRALVICLGAGNTVRTASRLFGAVDGVELVADVVRRLPLFESARLKQAGAPRFFVEDGRQFLLRSKDAYDLIVVDGAPPLYSAGGVNLLTSEFMRLARGRLSDKGIFCLWLPTQSFESDYWQIVRSAVDEFEHVRLWGDPRFTGFLILGSRSPIALDKAAIAGRVKARMPAIGMKWLDAQYVLDGLMLTPEQIRAQAARYAPLTDDKPAVEFPLPRFWRGEPQEPTIYFLAKARR